MEPTRLTQAEIEYDLEAVYHKLKGAIDAIVSSGEDISPRTAITVDMIMRDLNQLEMYLTLLPQIQQGPGA